MRSVATSNTTPSRKTRASDGRSGASQASSRPGNKSESVREAQDLRDVEQSARIDDEADPTLIQIHDQGPEDAGKYDICIVLKSNEALEENSDVEQLIEKLINKFGRKNLYLYESSFQDLTFILVRGSVGKLKLKAEKDMFPMLLDPSAAEKTALRGDADFSIQPLVLPTNPKESNWKPYEYIYAKYRTDQDLQHLYWRPADASHPFRRHIRLKLIHRILKEVDGEGNRPLDLDKMILDGVIQTYYPIHDWSELTFFKDTWIGPCSFPLWQPIQSIREYFGEKIAFYFAYTEFLSKWMILPLLMGIAFNIAGLSVDNLSRPEIPVFSFVLMLWAIIGICQWKQKVSILNLYWGNLIKENDVGSPDGRIRSWFKGQIINATRDGKPSLEYKSRPSALVSCTAVSFLLCCALASAVAIYVLKVQIKVSSVDPSRPWIISGITGGYVFIMNYVYHFLANVITHYENHRTDSEHKKALASRIFWLQFINNFSTFYYLAFAGPYLNLPEKTEWLDKTGLDNSVRSGAIHLIIANTVCVYGAQIVLKNFLFFLLPYSITSLTNLCMLLTQPDFSFSKLPCVRFDCFNSQSFKKLAAIFGCCSNDSVSKFGGRSSVVDDDSIQMWDIYSDASRSKSQYQLNSDGSNRRQVKSSGRDYSMLAIGGIPMNDAACLPELDFHFASFDTEVSLGSGGAGYSNSIFQITNGDVSSLYAEIILCLGYMLYFSMMFPLVTVLCWVDLYLLYRRHAWRLIHVYKRPFPESQISVDNDFFTQSEWQIWKTLFDLCISIAIVTNAGLIFFTLTTFKSITLLSEKIWCFISFVAFFMVFRAIIQKQIAAVPKKVKLQTQRTKAIVDKVIDRFSDDHSDPLTIL